MHLNHMHFLGHKSPSSSSPTHTHFFSLKRNENSLLFCLPFFLAQHTTLTISRAVRSRVCDSHEWQSFNYPCFSIFFPSFRLYFFIFCLVFFPLVAYAPGVPQRRTHKYRSLRTRDSARRSFTSYSRVSPLYI